MNSSGRTILITGPSRGIGKALALRFAANGDHLILAGRRSSAMDAVRDATGGVLLEVDLASRPSVEAFVTEVLARPSPVDVLINNAGIAESAPIERTTDELYERTMTVNASAPFWLCRALLPGMVARGAGRVINIASNAGRTGYAYTSAYCASKHALIGLTRALAAEVAKSGVTVNAICPGFVQTDMTELAVDRIVKRTHRTADAAREILANMSPQGRLIDPDEVAHVAFMLAAPAARGIHGQALLVDGGQVMA